MRRPLLFILCLLVAPAEAAISFVGAGSTSSGGKIETVTYTATAGNTVALGLQGEPMCTLGTVVDSGGNTYTQRAYIANANSTTRMWLVTATSIAAFTTITWTPTLCAHNGYTSMIVLEYSGSGSVDAVTTTNTANPSSATLTLTSGGNYVVAFAFTTSTSNTATSGTLRRVQKRSISTQYSYMLDVTSANAEAVTASLSNVGSAYGTMAIQLLLPSTPSRSNRRRAQVLEGSR